MDKELANFVSNRVECKVELDPNRDSGNPMSWYRLRFNDVDNWEKAFRECRFVLSNYKYCPDAESKRYSENADLFLTGGVAGTDTDGTILSN